jgi:uncharacterized membrane protein
MPSDEASYDEMRRRAEKRVRKRVEFNMHLAIYVVVNLGLWVMFGLLSGILHLPWLMLIPLLSTVGWGLGVAIHGIVTYMETRAMDVLVEREIRREMALRNLRDAVEDSPEAYEKPKRDRVARLSDDGELIYDEEAQRRQAGGRRARR